MAEYPLDPQLAKMVVASPEFRFASHAHAAGACPWLRWRSGAVARARTHGKVKLLRAANAGWEAGAAARLWQTRFHVASALTWWSWTNRTCRKAHSLWQTRSMCCCAYVMLAN